MLRLEALERVALLTRQRLNGDDVRLEPRELREQRLEQLGIQLLRQLREMRRAEHENLRRFAGDFPLVLARIEGRGASSERLGCGKGDQKNGHITSALVYHMTNSLEQAAGNAKAAPWHRHAPGPPR